MDGWYTGPFTTRLQLQFEDRLKIVSFIIENIIYTTNAILNFHVTLVKKKEVKS